MNNERNHKLDYMKSDFLMFLVILLLVKALGLQGSPAQKKCSKSTETFWSIWSVSSKLTIKIFEYIQEFNLLFP